MHDEDALHPNKALQDKLQHIYSLRRTESGRVNFEDNSFYLKLLESIGNPHLNLPPVVHVAGTNGKGSTIAMLRAMLEADGYKVNIYTSPHLLTFNERIYLAGAAITDDLLESYLDEMFEKNGDNPVTFFEFTTALAFLAFSRTPADIVLLETGMGGRLDCSNIIEKPLVTVITPISYDHMEFLGNTISQIAGEKAGIMKHSVPCVLSPQSPEAFSVFETKSQELDAPLNSHQQTWSVSEDSDEIVFSFLGLDNKKYPRPNLIGAHQIDNAGTALATLEVIKDQLPVSEDARTKGLQNIVWPGRMEHKTSGAYTDILPDGWELWFDCGHNVAGAQKVATILKEWQISEEKPTHILLSMKENKDIQGVIETLSPYAASLEQFKIGEDIGQRIKTVVTEHPFRPAKVLVFGSLYNYF